MSDREAIVLSIAILLAGSAIGSLLGAGFAAGLIAASAILLGFSFGYFMARMILLRPADKGKR